MSISTDILRVAIAVLGLLLLATTGALVAHGAWHAQRTRRLAPRIAHLHATFVQLAAGEQTDEAPREALRGVPLTIQLEQLADLLPSVSGPEAARLRDAIDTPRLLARARRRCGSRRWRRRLHGVRILALLDSGEQIVPALLADPRGEVQAAAAEWAGEHPSPPVIERLLEMLHNAAPFTRFTVMDALVRLGPAAAPALAQAIADGAPASALEVAARIGDPRLRLAVRARLHDADPAVRAWAGRLLGALGDQDDAAATIDLLADPDATVRAAAAVALGRLGYWPATAALAQRLRDPAWEVRRNAAHALRTLGAPGRLMLERALRDSDAFARDIAQQTLELPEAALPT